MIKIINVKPALPPKKSIYHIYINEDFICEFEHNRADKLWQCLITAGNEVEKTQWINFLNKFEKLEVKSETD